MLCAKYDYKLDISVKQEEAYEDGRKDGMNAGIEKGARENAIKNAKNLYKNGVTKEIISNSLNISKDELETILNSK